MGCDDDATTGTTTMCIQTYKKKKKNLYLQTNMKIRIFFSDEQTIGSVYHCNL